MLPMDSGSHSSVKFDPRGRGLDSFDVNRLLNQDLPTEPLSPYLRLSMDPDMGDDFEFPRDYTTSASGSITTIGKIHGMDTLHSLSPMLAAFNVIDLEPRDFRPTTEQYSTMECFNVPIKMEAEVVQEPQPMPLPISEEAQRSIGSSSESQTDSLNDSPSGKSLVPRSRLKKRLYTRAELEAQRAVANNRERQRTQSLNEAFSALRGVLPTAPSDKMSKFNTLKIAVSYISFLSSMLEQDHENGNGGMYDHEGHPKFRDNLSYAFSMWRMEGTLKGASNCHGSEQQGTQVLQQQHVQRFAGQDEEARWNALAKRFPH